MGTESTGRFAEALERWAEQTPDKPAVVTSNGTVGYAALDVRIGQIHNALLRTGVRPGDRVGVCAPNRVELVELLVACSRLGAMLFMINNRLTASEIASQLADCRPTLTLADAAVAGPIGEATDGRYEDLDRFAAEAYAASTGPSPLEVAVDAGPGDTGVLLVYTSGTTGSPKGAVLTNRSLRSTADNGIAHEGFGPNSVTICVLPMFHVGGLNVQLLPTLLAGGTVVLEERFDPVRLIELSLLHKPSHLLLVPAAMQALLQQIDNNGLDVGEVLGSLGALNCGSSIVPAELIERFADNGVPVVQVYGATETGPTAVVLDYADADRIGSCGKPAAHTELVVRTPSGVAAAPGEIGELLLRGPNLFVGYWENETATADAFDDGWYRTGDLGYVDRDGFTYVTGRTREMIISGGENIYPVEIEQCIERHPGVTAAAVVGRPDARWGETPVAVVCVAADGGATEAELRAWTEANLARFKQPTRWIFTDSMPVTSLGKVQKHLLRPLLEEA